MATSLLTITPDHATPITPGSGQAVVKVEAGGTVYYLDNPQVSSSSNLGSIASGASHTFTAPAWLISTASAAITVTSYAGSSTSPAGATDIVLGSDGRVGGAGGTALVSTVVTSDATTVGFYGATAVVQASRAGQLTDSSGGAVTTTLAAGITDAVAKNAVASLAAKVNALETIIHNLGLSA